MDFWEMTMTVQWVLREMMDTRMSKTLKEEEEVEEEEEDYIHHCFHQGKKSPHQILEVV
jgi:hypothetical protein